MLRRLLRYLGGCLALALFYAVLLVLGQLGLPGLIMAAVLMLSTFIPYALPRRIPRLTEDPATWGRTLATGPVNRHGATS